MRWKFYILVMLASLGCREGKEVPNTNLKAEVVAISHPSSVGDGLNFNSTFKETETLCYCWKIVWPPDVST